MPWHEDADEFLEDVLKPSGLTHKEFVEVGYLKGPDLFRLYQDKGFRTPTGKGELKLSTSEKFGLKPLPEYTGLPEEEDPDYPLILISAKSRYYLLSSWRSVDRLRHKEPDPQIEIHPETAAAHGITDGDRVQIETKHGKITQKARVTYIVAPRAVSAALGWWFPEAGTAEQYDWESSNFNMLTTTQKLGKEFGTSNIKNIPCRIRKHE